MKGSNGREKKGIGRRGAEDLEAAIAFRRKEEQWFSG